MLGRPSPPQRNSKKKRTRPTNGERGGVGAVCVRLAWPIGAVLEKGGVEAHHELLEGPARNGGRGLWCIVFVLGVYNGFGQDDSRLAGDTRLKKQK